MSDIQTLQITQFSNCEAQFFNETQSDKTALEIYGEEENRICVMRYQVNRIRLWGS